MDALSETLRVVRLSAAIFINGRFSAPWAYQSPRADAAAKVLEPSAERLVIFHLISEGSCYVEIDGHPPVHAVAGDAILFPNGDAHRMSSLPGVEPGAGANYTELFSRRPRKLIYGGGGAVTRLVCGYLACDARPASMLFTGLPAVVKVNLHGSDAGDWLLASVQYALAEARSPRPGGAGVLAKLAEVLFVEVLRQYMNEGEPGRTGWLAAVGDRVVGAALRAIHEEPGQPWTVNELARASCASRSVLSERFQQLVGSSPIQYLTRWRMLLASNLLRESNTPVGRIGEEVGYQNDTAFNRAFRREFGMPPASWRRKRGAPDGR
ncbi:MAG TPA: AraC family transcriptional regulator [Burkholderiaceae bacterium]